MTYRAGGVKILDLGKAKGREQGRRKTKNAALREILTKTLLK